MSLITNEGECLFIHLLIIYISLVSCLFRVFAHLSVGVYIFLLLICKCFSYLRCINDCCILLT